MFFFAGDMCGRVSFVDGTNFGVRPGLKVAHGLPFNVAAQNPKPIQTARSMHGNTRQRDAQQREFGLGVLSVEPAEQHGRTGATDQLELTQRAHLLSVRKGCSAKKSGRNLSNLTKLNSDMHTPTQAEDPKGKV